MFKKENLYLLMLPLCAVIAAIAVRIDNPNRKIVEIQYHTIKDVDRITLKCEVGFNENSACVKILANGCTIIGKKLKIVKSDLLNSNDNGKWDRAEGICE
jgi:hypothetical protein